MKIVMLVAGPNTNIRYKNLSKKWRKHMVGLCVFDWGITFVLAARRRSLERKIGFENIICIVQPI